MVRRAVSLYRLVHGPRELASVCSYLATDALLHRGPDERGTWSNERIFLGMRRLSIIDLAGGQQPIWNEDHTAAIVLNGEIYNHHQLRAGLVERGHRFTTHSDVETVLHLYEEKLEGCLDDLRGMFALAIWDQRERTLFLARDRLGKKPLYYAGLPEKGLVFGSEIKAILQHPLVERRPDPSAIDHFLTLQYVPSPHTAFEGIRRLPPAHWLRWQDGQVEQGRYWRLPYLPKFTEPEAELREEMLRLRRESVRIRLESEVPLGAFLSGGIDSSAVVAFAAEALSQPLKTFSIGFEPANSTEVDELTTYPVIDIMPDQRDLADKGGTMRLGVWPCEVAPGTRTAAAYGVPNIKERHRHRYELNNQYRDELVEKGMILSGLSPDGRYMLDATCCAGEGFVLADLRAPDPSQPAIARSPPVSRRQRVSVRIGFSASSIS